MFIWWLRIFKRLSIYSILIYLTISEIIEFFLIFVLCIIMFGNAVFVLNQSRLNQDSDSAPLYDKSLDWGFIDAIVN